MAIQRSGNYAVDYQLLALEAVAGKTRTMESHLLSASGTDVTDAFVHYLQPLLGAGMPQTHRLRGAKVARVLKA